MIDLEKVIKAIENNLAENYEQRGCETCPYNDDCHGCATAWKADALALLKENKIRELTIEEWQKWKSNPKRDPICKLWENDTSPMWILKPEDVHEPALLMGKLKLFTGKPTFEQCKAVKWE